MQLQTMLRAAEGLRPPALLVLASLLGAIPAPAQTAVAGRVLDESGAAVSHANVQLLALPDSTPAAATVSDGRGSFLLRELRPGAYRVRVSRLGYREHLSDAITLAGGETHSMGALVLRQQALELEGLTVEAERALYQQRGDRLVIHLGGSATFSGTSAVQVLERSPGVSVDRASGSISLAGRSGVRVLINGRPSHIPAEGVVHFLAGISADNLERIELIATPPASLDAEGNAGYVNIVLKRSPDDGLHGSLGASGGYGEGEVGNTSASLSYRRGATSISGSYSFLWNGQQQLASNYRRVVGAEGVTELPATSLRDPVQRNHDLRVNVERQVGPRTTLGAAVAAFDNRWSMSALNRLTIRDDGAPTTRIDSENDEVNHWRHAMGNLFVQQRLAGESTLRVDVDYLRFGNDNPTVYLNTSTDAASGRETRQQVESGKTTPLGILVARADYARPGERWALGAGAKAALSRFTNTTSLHGVSDAEWVEEAGFGSRSRLREDVLAAYASADYSAGPTTLKLGLRYELTDSNLGSDRARDIVDRRFGSFFPSVSLSHKLGEARQVDASYSRRINRPSFRDMAPFLYFFDPHTFFSGNAGLQPALTSALKLDATLGSLVASLQYAWEDSSIARFQSRFLPDHNVHVYFPTNFRGTRTAMGMLALPARMASWWSTQNHASLTWQEVDGVSNDVPTVLTSTSYRVGSSQKLSLPREHTFEVTGFYESATLTGATRFGARWQVDAALQRQLPGGARVTLAVNDVFDSFEWNWTTGRPGDPLYIDTDLDFWWRTVTLSYSRSFGGGRAAGRAAAASAEEVERVR